MHSLAGKKDFRFQPKRTRKRIPGERVKVPIRFLPSFNPYTHCSLQVVIQLVLPRNSIYLYIYILPRVVAP